MEADNRRIVVDFSKENAVFEKPVSFDNIFAKYKDTLEEMTAEWRKLLDQQVISGLKRAAGITTICAKEDLVAELKHAIDLLETPDYFLLANPAHADELEPLLKNIRGVKIRLICSPLMRKRDYILLRYGAVRCPPVELPPLALSVDEEVRTFNLVFNRKEIGYFKVKVD